MKYAEFKWPPEQQENLRELVGFMGRTAIRELEIEHIKQSTFRVNNRLTDAVLRGIEDRALNICHDLITQELQSVGGIELVTSDPDTDLTTTRRLIGWYGLAEKQPDHHIWDVEGHPDNQRINLPGDYLDELRRSLGGPRQLIGIHRSEFLLHSNRAATDHTRVQQP